MRGEVYLCHRVVRPLEAGLGSGPRPAALQIQAQAEVRP